MSVINDNLTVTGLLQPYQLAAPSGCITDNNMNASSPISANKYQPQFKRMYAQAYGAVAVPERKVIHIAKAGGNLYTIKAGLVLPNVGASTVTVDLKKNGVSVLTTPITLAVGLAYVPVNGAISTLPYNSLDVFELVITATAGGGTLGQGLFVDVIFNEQPG